LTPRKIAIVGAECVGKTSLCVALAERTPATWIAEVVREFCVARGRTPRQDEQHGILEAQVAREADAVRRAATAGHAWVLCDSAPILTALYSRHYFDDDSLVAPARIHHRSYAATLLLMPDLPWVADGILRDGPTVRRAVHDALSGLLDDSGIEVHPIAGSGEARRQGALAVLRTICNNPSQR